MFKRLPYYLILFLAVPCIAAVPALPQATPPKSVSGVVLSYDMPTTPSPVPLVTLYIKNISGKNISGYNIRLIETYADHIRDHQLSGDISLAPGETRKEIIGVQPGLQKFDPIATVIAYDDLTAEATDDDAFQRLNSTRKLMVTTRQAVNDDIKAALADPNDPDPAATAAKRVQDRITAFNAQKHRTTQGDFLPGAAQGMINELKNISSQSDKRNLLAGYLAKSEEHVKTLSPHANLTKIGGRP